jgi:hypothetical protein
MSDPRETLSPRPPSGEAGFTLVEALIAIVILIFGLMAVSNLFIVATSSTSVANQGSAAAVKASELLEILRATPWPNLAPGGSIVADAGPGTPSCDAAVLGTDFNCDADLPGVGRVHVRWEILTAPVGGGAAWTRTKFVQVQAEGTGALSGARSRSLFSMFRTCTDAPASAVPPGPCPDPPVGGGL